MARRRYQAIQLRTAQNDPRDPGGTPVDPMKQLVIDINDRFQQVFTLLGQTGQSQSTTSTALTFKASGLADVPQLGAGVLFEFSSPRALTIPGFGGGYGGRVVIIKNTSGFTYTIPHESTTALDVERVKSRTAANTSITAGNALVMVYDDTSQRWCPVGLQV